METYNCYNRKTGKDFTVLESLFIEALVNKLYAEEGFTDVDITNICDETGKTSRSMRGVLSSLIKKDVVCINVHDTYKRVRKGRSIVEKKTTIQLILLNEEFYYLHPNWSVENI